VLVGSTILVVDDDPTVRKALTARLLVSGHTVLDAADGAQALELLEEYTPDLILLDLQMPVLDGWGFVREFRMLGRAIPIVVMSAAHDVSAAAQELEVEDALTKPMEMAELSAAVTRWIGPHPKESTHRNN
jgi:CheY-like chemotaxis protein